VGIFHYFQFKPKPQRKEELAVGVSRRERENRMKGRRRAGELKITHHPSIYTPNLNPTLHRKRGKNLWTPVGIVSTAQAYSYVNFAVSVSTVAVLTGGAVLH